MKAVLADLSTRRYLTTAAAQRLPAGLGATTGWSRGGLLRWKDDQPEPKLPQASGWVRLRPELSGICGSDVGLAHAKLSLVLSAFYTAKKAIPGHEIVAVVDEVGPGVTAVSVGDRVVVDPIISCAQRGFDLCRSCAEGVPYVCERFDQPGPEGCTATGQGFDIAVGGGWGQYLVAHESQLYSVGRIASVRAVLAEPASIALHAALRWRRTGDRVIVIGPGTIGLLTVAALRMLHPDIDIIVLSPDEFGAHQAMAAGADRTLPSDPSTVETLAASDGGRVLRAKLTPIPLLERGVDAVFDCVALPRTIELGMHLLRANGTFVLVGGAGKQDFDWSLVWNRQLTVKGSVNSGPEPQLGGRTTMSQVVQWLGEPAFRVDGIVTHVYDLAQWREALTTASAGPTQQAVKVALRPNPDVELVAPGKG